MKSKNIRLIMELIFIFIIPLLVCVLCVSKVDNYVYDAEGNFKSDNQTISFTSPLNYLKEYEYINYLDFNQLVLNNHSPFENLDYYNISTDANAYIQNGNIIVELNNNERFTQVFSVSTGNKYFIRVIYYNYNNYGQLLVSFGNTIAVNLSSGLGIYDNFLTSSSNNALVGFYGSQDDTKIAFSYICVIDLTKMFGSGYEPSTIDDLSNYIDLSVTYDYTESQEIIYYSDNILSSNYTYNYTYIGHIKSLFTNYLELNDSVVLDFILCYTMLWLLMFIIWHLFYRVFDAVAHLVKTKGD